jgi:hypothetical protein
MDMSSLQLTEENKRRLENKRRAEIMRKKGRRKLFRGAFKEYFFR